MSVYPVLCIFVNDRSAVGDLHTCVCLFIYDWGLMAQKQLWPYCAKKDILKSRVVSFKLSYLAISGAKCQLHVEKLERGRMVPEVCRQAENKDEMEGGF